MSEKDYRDLIEIRPVGKTDLKWLRPAVGRHFGGESIVTTSGIYHLDGLPGLKAMCAGAPAGFAHYNVVGPTCEIVTLVSLRLGRGIGSALVAAVEEESRRAGCRRLWLTTTTNNVTALRFHQNRGFPMAAVHRDAMAKVREIKPDIPLIGEDGAPLRDLTELELDLTSDDREPGG